MKIEARTSGGDGRFCALEAMESRLIVSSPLGDAELSVGEGVDRACFLAVWTTPFFAMLWGTWKTWTWGLGGQLAPLWCDELRLLDDELRTLARLPAGAGWLEQPRYRAYATSRDLACLAPLWSYEQVAQFCAETGLTFVSGSTPHPRWFVWDRWVSYLRPPVGGKPTWSSTGVLRAPRR